ncbi:MAG: tetratricopeptide repeat protein [Bryobacterales bacterium]|nr:tetratricopeptide repeat protein [Bryobacterales bacterium]
MRSFERTGMGRSMTAPVAEALPSQAGRHGQQNWAVAWRRDGLEHRVGGETRRMAWAVGSGHEGKSYLWRAGDALFQSPLAWYSKRGSWDLSPGYAAGAEIDFLRPVTADCLFCHAGSSRPVPGSLHRYAAIPQPGIHCERCHGDGAPHAADPKRGNIVNPVRLAPAARDSVCEQCHLSGAARVPLPGKTFADFRPGMVLEEVFSVYLPVTAKAFKVVSHAEQLAESECAKASGTRMWCGSCHDPHGEPAEAESWYRERCQSCHANARPHGERCAECHMPRTAASDGGHTAFTDHRIRKPGPAAVPVAVTGLRAWREPEAQWRARGLGLAYAGAGDLQRAFPLLRETRGDGEAQSALGLVYLRAGRTEEAVAVLEQAVRAEPRHSSRRLNLAAALLAAGRRERAKAEAEQAIALEPLLRDAYVLLAEIEPRRAAYWRARFETELRK